MRRRLRRLLVLFALAIAYLLLFPVPTRRELVLDRHWATDAAAAQVIAGSRQAAIPFAFPSVFGYLSPTGDVVFRGGVSYGAAVSPEGFISYGRTPDQLVLQNPDGSYRSTVPLAGYPHFAGERLFVTGPGGSSVSFRAGADDRSTNGD